MNLSSRPRIGVCPLAKGHCILADFGAGAVAQDQMEVDPDRAHHRLNPHPILLDLSRLRFWGSPRAWLARLRWVSRLKWLAHCHWVSQVSWLACLAIPREGVAVNAAQKGGTDCSGGRGIGLHPEFPLSLGHRRRQLQC